MVEANKPLIFMREVQLNFESKRRDPGIYRKIFFIFQMIVILLYWYVYRKFRPPAETVFPKWPENPIFGERYELFKPQ